MRPVRDMGNSDESRVIRFADAQACIPGANGERSVNFLRRDTLDVSLSRPLPPNEQKRDTASFDSGAPRNSGPRAPQSAGTGRAAA